MFAKVVIVLAVFSTVYAGQDAPPQKVHTYNVPSVAKVSYPGPTVTKSVETYSAPSIEKTTTITRTITAPLNAPSGKRVSYAAPAPVLKAAAVYGAPAIAAPVGYAHAAPVAYAHAAPVAYAHAAPVGYAAYAHPGPVAYAQPAYHAQGYAAQGYAAQGYAAPAYAAPAYAAAAPIAYAQPAASAGVVSAPGLAYNSAPLNSNLFSNQFASIYNSPSLGDAVSQHQFFEAAPGLGAPAFAAVPAVAAGPVPIAKNAY